MKLIFQRFPGSFCLVLFSELAFRHIVLRSITVLEEGSSDFSVVEVEINEISLSSMEEGDVVDQSGVVGAIVDGHGDGEILLSAEKRIKGGEVGLFHLGSE